MADALEAAMPAPLDASRKDDDFGRFIHAVHGVLIARHGLEQPERALDALYAATQRFSMEYAIRPYLNRWPEETLARMEDWARDDHYHVRRLVSEGTRPKLPWGRKVEIDPRRPLALLDVLHADPTRFVTRSVANHLNDVSKIAPEAVVGRLRDWKAQGAQEARELDWMTRHALRTAVKRGEGPALALLGYEGGRVRARLEVLTPEVAIGGVLEFAVTLEAEARLPVMVDYRLRYARPKGTAEKVFKLKVAEVRPGGALRLVKRHRLLGDATTYKLHPGVHGITVQVNGEDVAEGGFDLVSGP
jgi:3-methyladenine DNA glycosylase AlkC